jgi:tight adherence protein C
MDLLSFSRPVILLLVFAAVVLLAWGGLSYFGTYRAVRRRVAQEVQVAAGGGGRSLRSQQAESAWVRLVNFVEKRGLSLADTRGDELRKKMISAGYTHPAAPRIFTLVRLVLTLGLPVAFVSFAYSMAEPPGWFKLYLFAAGLALAGLYVPNLFVTAKADRRRQALLHALPDALDLMLVCVEAGLGIEAAFDRVGREMTRSHPLLAELLGTVVLELRAGRSRDDALRRMADRSGLDEIRSFATLLIQSGKLGSSIADTLRIYASEMREKRRMRAEEKAHRLPVLISLPLVGCMLPVMIGVLMLPAVIRVFANMLPAMGN